MAEFGAMIQVEAGKFQKMFQCCWSKKSHCSYFSSIRALNNDERAVATHEKLQA